MFESGAFIPGIVAGGGGWRCDAGISPSIGVGDGDGEGEGDG